MTRVYAGRVSAAVALIGLLFATSVPASAQSARRQAAQTELRKKAPKPKPALVRSVPVRKQAAPVEQMQTTEPFAQPLPIPRPPQAPPPAVQPVADQPASRSSGPPSPVTAAPVANTLNMVRTAPEQIGQMPSQLMWIRDGLMAARDPLDGALVFFDDDGCVLGRAKFPNGFDTEDIVGQPNAIRLIDASHRMQITIPRTVDPAAITVLDHTLNMSAPDIRAQRLQRRGPQELILNDDRQAAARPLTVRSIAGGQLAQAYEVSPGTGDSRFVVSEEIAAVKPALQVRVFVQRFDKESRLTGVVYVPLDGFELVPRNFIAITGAGLARVLRPTVGGVKIDEYDFVAPPRAGNRRLNDGEFRSLSRKLREMPVDTAVQGDNSTPLNENPQQLQVEVSAPPIARATVLANARAYLTVNWIMQRENFSRPGIENRCDPANSYVWLRPRHFSEDMIGTTVGPMPYRWGGEDTPATFRTRTEWGALAGNICTCRQPEYNYCLFADSAGVDCSGFVSRAWGIEKRGTAGILDVATDLDSIEALRPGDAFDWPQRHIRLFVALAPGAATAFTVLESSTRYQCDGVCERVYRPSEMNGYKLIRYKGISETAVATNGGGQNGGAKPNGTAAATGTTATGAPAPNGGAKPNGTAAATVATNGGTAGPAKKRITRSASATHKRTRQR